MSESYLDGLNPQQREAVCHPGGPLLIVAGAGTGKTRVVTTRVAHLVHQGVDAHRILAITFTNKAAREMRERVGQLVPGGRVWVSTFHAFGARALRVDGAAVGVPPDFAICDRDDQVALVRRLLKARDERSVRPEAVLEAISRWKSSRVPPASVLGSPDPFENLCAEIFEEYRTALASEHLLDFDDLLLKARELVCDSPLSERWADRFDHVLVDEYQDTNDVQCELAEALSSRSDNLSVCGDPDQSIYSWRGADLSNILEFRHKYPEVRVVRLERNYRSTPAILAVANAVIANNTQRLDRELYSEGPPGEPPRLIPAGSDTEESEAIASEILGILNTTDHRPADIAVLFRTNALSRGLERSLRGAGVPYRLIGAVQFFARREIKDLLAFLRLKAHPWDAESFLRIVNTPARGIGDKSQALLMQAIQASSDPVLEILADPARRPKLRGTAAKGLGQLVELLAWMESVDEDDLVAIVEEVIDRIDYREFLRASYGPGADERIDNVRELLADLDEYQRDSERPSVQEYLEQRALVQDSDAVDDAGQEVQLMTLHSSKGLEFRTVFLCGLEEAVLPHRRSIEEGDVEEERRLFYVGITRARERLILSFAGRRFQFGSAGWCDPSRFLAELPRDQVSGNLQWATTWDDGETFHADPEFAVEPEVADPGGWDEPVFERDAGSTVPDAEQPRFTVGDDVEHASFGRGSVARVSGRGDRQTVDVDFPDGRRSLHLAYTQLRRVHPPESNQHEF